MISLVAPWPWVPETNNTPVVYVLFWCINPPPSNLYREHRQSSLSYNLGGNVEFSLSIMLAIRVSLSALYAGKEESSPATVSLRNFSRIGGGFCQIFSTPLEMSIWFFFLF